MITRVATSYKLSPASMTSWGPSLGPVDSWLHFRARSATFETQSLPLRRFKILSTQSGCQERGRKKSSFKAYLLPTYRIFSIMPKSTSLF